MHLLEDGDGEILKLLLYLVMIRKVENNNKKKRCERVIGPCILSIRDLHSPHAISVKYTFDLQDLVPKTK